MLRDFSCEIAFEKALTYEVTMSSTQSVQCNRRQISLVTPSHAQLDSGDDVKQRKFRLESSLGEEREKEGEKQK